jgi:hypothetical protein
MQLRNASLGRYAMQGKADAQCKSVQMHSARQGRCARQGRELREARRDRCARIGRAYIGDKAGQMR